MARRVRLAAQAGRAAAAVSLAFLSAGAAAPSPRSELDLYSDTLYFGANGLTCFPVGLQGDALQRSAERLRERRGAIGETLRLRYGHEAVDSIENALHQELADVDYTSAPCDMQAQAEARRKLGRTLRVLERRLGLTARP